YFVGNLVQDQDDENFLERELGERPIVFFPVSKAVRRAERAEQAIVTISEGLNDAPGQLVDSLLSKG
ncbi:MAG: carbon monoxide dehydrogenase, partial [Candidatus Electrothrix sp. AR1]|nr:carbon monoxide dehydrogenase [Candidatus Electrothrix sp. AR1]